MSFDQKRDGGFTMIELLVVIAVTGVLFAIGSTNLFNFRESRVVKGDIEKLTFKLNEAQVKARSQDNSSRWGVRLENPAGTGNDYYELWYGDSYAVGTVVEKVNLNGRVNFTNPTDGNSKDITFEKVTGLPLFGESMAIRVNNLAGIAVVEDSGKITSSVEDGLVAMWQLDGGPEDVTGSYDGTVVGSPGWPSSVSCEAGPCVDLDGATTWISLSNTIDLPEDSPWTIMYWYYQDSTHKMTIGQNGVNFNRFYHRATDSYVRIHFDTGFGVDINYAEPLNAWRHLAVTNSGADSNNINGYVDGQFVETESWASTRFQINNIGYPFTSTLYVWDGKLDEVRVYDRELSADEVQKIYSDTR